MNKKVWISKMTGKMEGIPSINVNPLSNTYCNRNVKHAKNICNHCYCYSKKMLKTYRKNCVNKWEQNSKLLSEYTLKKAPIFNKQTKYIRFHSHGELINKRHLKNLYKIADKNSHVTFALFTKRKKIVQAVKNPPNNIVFIYSNPIIDDVKTGTIIPEGFDKTFTVLMDNKSKTINCKQKCKTCLRCYKKTGDKYIFENLK